MSRPDVIRVPTLTHTTEVTSGSYAAHVPTDTEPTGDGILEAPEAGIGMSSPILMLELFTNANNATASILVGAWDKVGTTWVFTPLVEVDCVSGNIAGVAATTILNTRFLADTMAAASWCSGLAGITYTIRSPENDTVARLRVDVEAGKKVGVYLKKGSASNVNAVAKFLGGV